MLGCPCSSLLSGLLLLVWPSAYRAVIQQPRTGSASARTRLLLTGAHQDGTLTNSMVVTQSGYVERASARTPGTLRVNGSALQGETAAASWSWKPSNVSCASEDAVWILVLKDSEKPSPVDRKRFNLLTSMSPLCVEILRPPHMNFRNFWEQKQVTVKDYLLDNPTVKFVVVTDTYDVYVNPFSRSELLSRFDELTKGKVRILLATEQNCYWQRQCNAAEAQQWLDLIRPGQGRRDARSFANSQYMGERTAVLNFLSSAMDILPGLKGFSSEYHSSDQAMFSTALAADPRSAILDFDEVIFASFLRGLTPVKDGNLTCNFGGSVSLPCDVKSNWGHCTRAADGAVAVQEAAQEETRRTIAPLIWHLNGPTVRAADRSDGCSEAFGNLPLGY